MGRTLLKNQRKSNFIKVIFVVLLLVIYMYICCIVSTPNNVVVFEGENISLKLAKGLTLKSKKKYETVLTSSNMNNQKVGSSGSSTVELSLFGGIKLKDISVDVLKKTKVIPVGTAIGMKLYTKGVLVVGMSQIEIDENKKEKPYQNSGIEQGDTIVEINGNEVGNTEELINAVNDSKRRGFNNKICKKQ